jgi:hypothetical protein
MSAEKLMANPNTVQTHRTSVFWNSMKQSKYQPLKLSKNIPRPWFSCGKMHDVEGEACGLGVFS